jgi:hypothetical protein
MQEVCTLANSMGNGGVAALAKVPGLMQLSLFGCELGGEQGAHVQQMQRWWC